MLGFLDLKTGVTLVVLFAVRTHNPLFFSLPLLTLFSHQVLNKVAGIYGLIALLTGAGGNAAQLTLYIYSALALIGLSWGIRAVHDVRSLIRSTSSSFAHICPHIGESEAHALFCPHVFRRPHP